MAYHRRMAIPAPSAGFFAGRTEQGSKDSLQVVADPGAASRTKQGSKGLPPLGGVWGVPQYGSNKAKVRSGLTRPEPESGESPDPVPKEVHANVQVSCAHSASAPV